MTTRTLRDALNDSNPNHVGDALHALPAGEAFSLVPRNEVLSVVAGVAVPSVPCIGAPIAFDRTNGVYLQGTAPETVAGPGQITDAPNGNLSVDPACLEVEVMYLAAEGTPVTETVQVTGSVATLLAGKTAPKVLSATIVAGIALGPKTVAARASAPAAGSCALTADGAHVAFNAADVVNGQATITYVARPSQSVSQRLGSPVVY